MSRAQQANDRAADFIERRETCDWTPADQAELDTWLAESLGNRAAYWRLDHAWREADRISALGPVTTPVEAERAPVAARVARPMRWAIAASLAAAIGLGAGGVLWQAREAPVRMASAAPDAAIRFATPVGGKRIVPLEDGSKVELNTASVVRASITAANRDVWLDQGEAYFEVAHVENRPFVVHAGSRAITVLGTKFSVRRDGDRVIVSVVEGRVRVAEANSTAQAAAVIGAGDMVVAQGPATLLTQKSEERVQDALSWRAGMLNFDQSPLPAVASEFNRYNHKPIVIVGAEAAQRRIGGAFPATDPHGFARLLGSAYGLRVEENTEAIIISD